MIYYGNQSLKLYLVTDFIGQEEMLCPHNRSLNLILVIDFYKIMRNDIFGNRSLNWHLVTDLVTDFIRECFFLYTKIGH